MKTILTILFLWANTASATNYYFSWLSGSDGGAGTFGSPWQTLAKFKTLLPTLSSGDSVLFKRGEEWYGNMLRRTGSSQFTPYVIGAYGTGSKPVITGFKTLSSWTSLGSNLYEASITGVETANVKIVTINGTAYAPGRYPNASAGNGGYLTYESFSGSSQITDNQLTTSPYNWTGAGIVIKRNRWVIDVSTVTSHSGGTLNFTTPSGGFSGINHYGYYFQNDSRTLDQQGEWWYDRTNNKLRLYSTTNPSAFTVKASTIDTICDLYSKFYVTFDNIVMEGSNMVTMAAQVSSDIVIKNCELNYNGFNGFEAITFPNNTFINNRITNTGNNGLKFYNSDNTYFYNNYITNTGLFPGMGASGNQARDGVVIDGTGVIIRENIVKNSGYCGIVHNMTNGLVYRNYVDSSCVVATDGGGIYCAGNDRTVNRIVRNNIVTNVLGNTDGTDASTPDAGSGIYLDDRSQGVTIDSNHISNVAEHGVYLHNSHEVIIRNNTIFDMHKSAVGMDHDGLEPNDSIRNVTIKRNIFFNKATGQYAIFASTLDNDVNRFGVIDSNYYYSPSQAFLTRPLGPSTGQNTYNMSTWRSTFGYDGNTSATTVTAPIDSLQMLVNPSLSVQVAAVNRLQRDLRGINRPVATSVLSWNSDIFTDYGIQPVVVTVPYVARRVRAR